MTSTSPYLNNPSAVFNYSLDGSLFTAYGSSEEDISSNDRSNSSKDLDRFLKLGTFYGQICDILKEIVSEYQVYLQGGKMTTNDAPSIGNSITCLEDIHRKYGIEIIQVTGGITNQLYKISPCVDLHRSTSGGISLSFDSSSVPTPVLIRVYGANTEVIIDRKIENIFFAELSQRQVSPIYYGQFQNGRIEGFLDSKCFEPEEMGQNRYVPLIAKELSRFHSLDMKDVCIKNDIPTEPCAFKCISQWLEQAKVIIQEITSPAYVKEGYNIEGKITREKESQIKIEPIEERQRKASLFTNEYINKLETEVEFLKEYLLPENSLTTKFNLTTRAEEISKEIIFGHQDLLSGNILYNEKWDPPRVQFIDYEYGGYNYRIFDTINHFIEHSGFEVDIENLYPNKDTQFAFFRAYFENFSDEFLFGEHSQKNFDRETFLEEWYFLCNKWVIVSHLYWGVWAIIQSKFSLIDFDFLGYSKLRLSKYYVQKSMFYEE